MYDIDGRGQHEQQIGGAIAWVVEPQSVLFEPAHSLMKARARAISEGRADELIWLVQHPPLYTAGTSAIDSDLIWRDHFPVYRTGRGGKFTYHGPGQRVVYVMLDIRRRGGDIRAFVRALEDWIISALASFNIEGFVRPDRIGVWVARPEKGVGVEEKIAAIGLRIHRGVSFHGFSLNVAPDLSHFEGIVPCGLPDHGVTSLADLGLDIEMSQVDAALRTAFENEFGPVSCSRKPLCR